LRNSAGAGVQITSSDRQQLEPFIVTNDQRGWGTYFCVSTMIDDEHHHEKEPDDFVRAALELAAHEGYSWYVVRVLARWTRLRSPPERSFTFFC
jgi:hypothetical protein